MKLLAIALCSFPLALLACSSAEDDGPAEPTDTSEEPTDPDPSSTDETTGDETTGPTSAAPAMCEVDADCPEGVPCVTTTDPATGEEGPGYCDVDETTMAAPAMCDTDADCPEGVPCTSFGDGPGFCDVSEMTAN